MAVKTMTTELLEQTALRVPPHQLEAEQATLGSILIDQEAIVKIADRIQPEDFYVDKHRLIFDAMLSLYQRHEPIDLIALANLLGERGHLENLGGRSWLVSLSNAVPTAAHVVQYATIIQKKSTLRRLITAATSMVEMGYREAEDVTALLDEAEQSLFSVSQRYLKQNFINIRDVLHEAFERIDQLHHQAGQLRGVSTGFAALDNILGGLQKSDLIVLAARPSVGKTGLALDMARNVAIKTKLPVGLFSLEMSKEQLVDRLLVSQADIDLWKMRTGRLKDDEDFQRIGHAMGLLAEAPIYIDDSATANIMEIRTKARRLQSEHKTLGLIVVDYLQLMESRNSENRTQEISEITRGLKSIARELNVPVLALSQLSRAVEQERPPIPKLAHLRESGSIEQDADVVLFIYRPAVYDPDLEDAKKNLAEIFIAKHRNGPTGRIKLSFIERKASFDNREERVDANQFQG
ncbi:MAG: replicative DNA helicase [Candidatus Kerfeldbacteria bacterium]|nr:replicative DNA helicase [Candidatus Kerfeldbacteria bacterium]